MLGQCLFQAGKAIREVVLGNGSCRRVSAIWKTRIKCEQGVTSQELPQEGWRRARLACAQLLASSLVGSTQDSQVWTSHSP